MRDLVREFRSSARLFSRQPGLWILAVLTLGAGVGVNSTVFAMIRGMLVAVCRRSGILGRAIRLIDGTSALGAKRRDILELVFRGGLRLVGAGMVFGLILAYLAGHALASLLVDVKAADPALLSLSIAGLLLAAALACWVPARRAASVDPAVVLRSE